jgi:primosomal protein N' (replication factor Y)
MAQVSGRSGRKNKRGKVIIQTRNPGHSIISYVVNNDYEGMYQYEMQERSKFHYPPFYRLILLTLKHKEAGVVQKAAEHLAAELRYALGKSRVLGPEFPLVARIRNYYLKNILIKIEKEGSVIKAKRLLSAALASFAVHKEFKRVIVQPDVDPV